ncbi:MULTISPECIES: hypothetical protein [Nocardiaceae]|uniref:Uncharacterized protein n=1 Tax=Rhodococcoides corynebacterioides TaxID=53972 RepID=A0ABS2KU63_9NOCA|nr:MULTISPECIES: hypothetical protein [Rhodococcus]MBM7415484.1 hypothetical protein [Rhodococcus corynebacterioides]MBP1117946.1 hypothetical protein [Rhodococcus sp. PvP016]
MSWTSSPKDSVLGLAVLLYIGTALVVPISVAAVSALGGAPYDVVPGWFAVGVLAFCVGAYTTIYAAYGLYLKAVSAHSRRTGPAVAARLETGAVVLAWVSLVAGLISLAPGFVVASGVICAAVGSVAGAIVRRRASRGSERHT